ncbi:MAG: TetR family transcriptional regulator [Acidimicrobiales bacterium]
MKSETTAEAVPERRPRLNRRQVLEAALRLVDRDGLDELSMRKLAAELGVEAMSLYKHVANKDDLLAGLADLVWAEIAAAAPARDDWPAWLRTVGHAVRDVVHRHPRALPVLVSGDVSPVSALELFADQLERRGPAAPGPDQAVSALRAVTAFALGCVVTELCCFGPVPANRDETERQRLLRVSRALPPDTPDRLLDTALAVCGDCDAEKMFTEGLDLIVAGAQPRHRRR